MTHAVSCKKNNKNNHISIIFKTNDTHLNHLYNPSYVIAHLDLAIQMK